MSEGGPYTYRQDVLDAVWRHGIMPTDAHTPELARGFVRDLYKYEIRRLRERYLKKEFPKAEYSTLVEQLRNRYGVLALVPRQWVNGVNERRVSDTQFPSDHPDEDDRILRGIQRERGVVIRRFEVGELTVEQGGAGEVVRSSLEARGEERAVGVQIDETDRPQIAAKQVAVAGLQRRAGDHRVFAAVHRPGDDLVKLAQPRRAVVVSERAGRLA